MRTAFLFAAILTAGAAVAQTPIVEPQAAYLVRCKRDTIASFPAARAQADAICNSKWEQVVAAAPIAETVLALAPAPGGRFDPAAVPARAAGMRGFNVSANRPPSPAGVAISWFRDGEPIPFDLEDALRVRGATLATIGCMQFGVGEGTRVYRVTAVGKTPFALTVAFRNAAVASQSSDYSATTDFSGRMPTLAALQRDGNDWTPTCPA